MRNARRVCQLRSIIMTKALLTSPLIRLETPADIPAIHGVVAQAFGQDAEALLVDRLRENGKFALDLTSTGLKPGLVRYQPEFEALVPWLVPSPNADLAPRCISSRISEPSFVM